MSHSSNNFLTKIGKFLLVNGVDFIVSEHVWIPMLVAYVLLKKKTSFLSQRKLLWWHVCRQLNQNCYVVREQFTYIHKVWSVLWFIQFLDIVPANVLVSFRWNNNTFYVEKFTMLAMTWSKCNKLILQFLLFSYSSHINTFWGPFLFSKCIRVFFSLDKCSSENLELYIGNIF